jgi:hypothetical protein
MHPKSFGNGQNPGQQNAANGQTVPAAPVPAPQLAAPQQDPPNFMDDPAMVCTFSSVIALTVSDIPAV